MKKRIFKKKEIKKDAAIAKAQADRDVAIAQAEADRPKVIFADAVDVSHESILIGNLAKILRQNGVKIGQNRLYKYCRDNKLLCSRKGRQWNKPTQKAIEAGLFNLEVSGGFRTVTLITPRGLKYLTDKLMSETYPLLMLIETAEED